jgi:two-component system sensor histidine kinase/response regulator
MILIAAMVRSIYPGVKLLKAVNGVEALEILRGERVDLILMDLQLPEMDGIETTIRIREGEIAAARGHVPIYALTAGAFREKEETCLEAGMDGFLTKPVNRDNLKAILQKHIERNGGARSFSGPRGSAAHFDREDFLGRIGGDRDLFSSLLREIPVRMEVFFAEMAEATVARDAARIRMAAHALKGVCGNLGFVKMARLALELEEKLDAGPREWKRIVNSLRREWQVVAALIVRY